MMTASAGNEIALFDMTGDAVAERGSRKSSSKSEVATRTGETARDILGGWVGYCKERTGLTVPKTVRGRISTHIKSLISDDYQSTTIKNALLVWTVRWIDNPLTSPSMLEQIAWKLAMNGTPEGRRFQDELKAASLRLNGTTFAGTAREKRAVENEQGKQSWRERYAERKRMEESL